MPSSLIRSMIEAALAGSSVLLDGFSRLGSLTVSEKGPSDFVSQADVGSEAVIKERLGHAHPGVPFQAEETSEGRISTGARFVIDPLDGTTNFLHGIPHWAISIAFWDDAGPAAGVILDPVKGELFWGERGQGAWVRRVTPGSSQVDRRLAGTTIGDLEHAVVHTGVPHLGRDGHERYLRELAGVMKRVAGIRRLGAAALDFAYVAAGRGEAFFERGLQPWDMAAGIVLVQEVGGVVTDYAGGPDAVSRSEVVTASSPGLHAALMAAIRSESVP